MARYKITLAYDGTDFAGYQRQKTVLTIQGEVENALRKIGWEGKSILAAGRTDTGVHAEGQVIAFDLRWEHAKEDLLNALNANLSNTISARSIELASTDFHPRYGAIARRYVYRIVQDPIPNPLEERYAWRIWPEVRLDQIGEVIPDLIGTHDFSAFGQPYRRGGRTVREIIALDCRGNREHLEFNLIANAYLYHMVRRIVFSLVQVGQGRASREQIRQMVKSGKPDAIQGMSPPAGLFLMQVFYSSEELQRALVTGSFVAGRDHSG